MSLFDKNLNLNIPKEALHGKELIGWDDLVLMMNPIETAFHRVGLCGATSISQTGHISEGEYINIDGKSFGLFIGNSFNPLIYRGENKEHPDFTPTLQRGNYIKKPYDKCEDVIKKMIFLDHFRTTPYYTRCKEFKAFGLNMYFDFEAIAQHYGFPTNYIDITRDINVALFFAYTFYKDGSYYPITNFEEYKPVLYVGNIKDVYAYYRSVFKLISFQAVVRSYRQKAMALNCENHNGLKQLFKKIELPQSVEFAMGVYEHFVGGEMLMPTGKIFGLQDPVGIYANSIINSNLLNREHIIRYCQIYGCEQNVIEKLLREKGFNVTDSNEIFVYKEGEYEAYYEWISRDINMGIVPMLTRMAARGKSTPRYIPKDWSFKI